MTNLNLNQYDAFFGQTWHTLGNSITEPYHLQTAFGALGTPIRDLDNARIIARDFAREEKASVSIFTESGFSVETVPCIDDIDASLTYQFDSWADDGGSIASCATCGQSVASSVSVQVDYEPPAVDLLMEALRGITTTQYYARQVEQRGNVPNLAMRALHNSLDTVYTQLLHAVRQSRRERHTAYKPDPSKLAEDWAGTLG